MTKKTPKTQITNKQTTTTKLQQQQKQQQPKTPPKTNNNTKQTTTCIKMCSVDRYINLKKGNKSYWPLNCLIKIYNVIHK